MDGNLLKQIGTPGDQPGSLQGPSNLALTGRNSVVVTDMLNARIQEISLDGSFIREVRGASGGFGPIGIAVGPTGDIALADSESHQVKILSPEGELKKTIGAEGSGLGQFESPSDVAFHGPDIILVSDMHNHRIQVISIKT